MVVPNIVDASGRSKFHNSPRLPEPMVFDLVLPLGAKKNEFELNTLFQYDSEHKAALINPEFEYAYTDGYGIEFELPTENLSVDAYKLALQGTFNFLNTNKFIHGWQYYGEYHRHNKELENNLLYIAGYQFNEKWDTLNMVGIRFTDVQSEGHVEELVNSSLFYSYSSNLIMGLEVNWESRPNRPDITLVMPQLHVQVAKHAKIQAGFGMKQVGRETFPHVATRIIFGF
ncbi:hypothetical protein SAMN05421690_10931 [Nitrosomonas sp. Nm51]|nr:hypothetical protein SAMN05421690_10931 [Nitrosomonas sp. Nm51]